MIPGLSVWNLHVLPLCFASPDHICALPCIPLPPTSRVNVLCEDRGGLCMAETNGGSSALPANVSKEQIIKSV